MKKYKLLCIIIIGIIITILISNNRNNKMNLTSIGDSMAFGNTIYNIKGNSYNDYLREFLEQKNVLDEYNDNLCINNLTIEKLNYMLDNNYYEKKSKKTIKQLIASSEIITLGIGIDEFNTLSTIKSITEEEINNYLYLYNELLKKIRGFYDKKIIVLSLYKTNNMNNNTILIINRELNKIANKYECDYIDVYPISINNKYFINNNYYMNYLAHQEIFKIIKKRIDI